MRFKAHTIQNPQAQDMPGLTITATDAPNGLDIAFQLSETPIHPNSNIYPLVELSAVNGISGLTNPNLEFFLMENGDIGEPVQGWFMGHFQSSDGITHTLSGYFSTIKE